jgi:hypothetical protein
MKILSRPELEKLNDRRLLAIRRKLTPLLASGQASNLRGDYIIDLTRLIAYDSILREVMATRPHVPRKSSEN